MEDLPRRQVPQYQFDERGQRGGQDHYYQSRENSNSNAPAPHAPHGSPFGLFEAISSIKDIRNPQAANTDRMPRQDAYYNSNNGYYAPQGPLPDRREDRGSTNPLSKLLKKVRVPNISEWDIY